MNKFGSWYLCNSSWCQVSKFTQIDDQCTENQEILWCLPIHSSGNYFQTRITISSALLFRLKRKEKTTAFWTRSSLPATYTTTPDSSCGPSGSSQCSDPIAVTHHVKAYPGTSAPVSLALFISSCLPNSGLCCSRMRLSSLKVLPSCTC